MATKKQTFKLKVTETKSQKWLRAAPADDDSSDVVIAQVSLKAGQGIEPGTEISVTIG